MGNVRVRRLALDAMKRVAKFLIDCRIKLEEQELRLQRYQKNHEARKVEYNEKLRKLVDQGHITPVEIAELEQYIQREYNERWNTVYANMKPETLTGIEDKKSEE